MIHCLPPEQTLTSLKLNSIPYFSLIFWFSTELESLVRSDSCDQFAYRRTLPSDFHQRTYSSSVSSRGFQNSSGQSNADRCMVPPSLAGAHPRGSSFFPSYKRLGQPNALTQCTILLNRSWRTAGENAYTSSRCQSLCSQSRWVISSPDTRMTSLNERAISATCPLCSKQELQERCDGQFLAAPPRNRVQKLSSKRFLQRQSLYAFTMGLSMVKSSPSSRNTR